MIEHFECSRRARVLSVVDCGIDRRLAQGACDGCHVGDVHARLELARRWPSGDSIRWVGEQPDFEAEDAARDALSRERRPTLELVVDNDADVPAHAAAVVAALAPAVLASLSSPRSEERSDRTAPPLPPPVGDRSAPRGSETVEVHVETQTTSPDSPDRYRVGDRDLTIAEWAREADVRERGIKYYTLHSRLQKYRWPIERAITEPPARRGKRGADVHARLTVQQVKLTATTSTTPSSPNLRTDAHPGFLAALDALDEQIDHHEAELARLCRLGNELCHAAGIAPRYETETGE